MLQTAKGILLYCCKGVTGIKLNKPWVYLYGMSLGVLGQHLGGKYNYSNQTWTVAHPEYAQRSRYSFIMLYKCTHSIYK